MKHTLNNSSATCVTSKSGFFANIAAKGQVVKVLITNEHVVTKMMVETVQDITIEFGKGPQREITLDKEERTIFFTSIPTKRNRRSHR